MIIYIEQVLIDNFIINFFIILTLKTILKAKINKINMVLSSLLGSVVALLLPLFGFNLIINSLVKILLSLVMVIVLKKFVKFKEYILYYLTFLFITFLYGGACLFILMYFDKNFKINNFTTYSLPLGVIVLIVFFIMIVIKNIFKNFYNRKKINNYIYKIVIENNAEKDELLGFLDSGNTLVDSLTGKPITVVNYSSLKNVLKDISITDIILNKETKLNKFFKNVHIIETTSIGNNKNKILIIEVEKLEIYLDNSVNIINNAIIGLTLKNFINDLGYSALLNSKLI
mgnify:FL=1